MDIVFFDGVCGLCNGFVDFLSRFDKHKKLRYSPLQGTYIQTTKAAPFVTEGTLIFMQGDKIYLGSAAVIRSIADLGGFWKAFIVLLIFPPFIGNFFYRLIAKHRYVWFGKKETCRVPTESEKPYFLD